MVDAIVLAAGMSRRMGEKNKLLLPLGAKTVIESVIEEIISSTANKTIVVLGFQHAKILEKLNKYPVEFIFNSSYRKGQTTSIQSAMSLITQESNGFMVCLGDMPLLKTSDYNWLIDHFNQSIDPGRPKILRPTYKGNPGNPVIFDKRYVREIMACGSEDGCREVIRNNHGNYKPIEVNELKYFFDIDSSEDYDRLLRSIE